LNDNGDYTRETDIVQGGRSMNDTTTSTPRPFFVFPCSGAADVGEISDKAARQLSGTHGTKMYCMAGIAAGIETMTETAKNTRGILAIDGCPMECNRKILEKNGFCGFEHVVITSLGMAKGSTPATDYNIQKVVARLREFIDG
jgi:uncharacterized metal-binding protein